MTTTTNAADGSNEGAEPMTTSPINGARLEAASRDIRDAIRVCRRAMIDLRVEQKAHGLIGLCDGVYPKFRRIDIADAEVRRATRTCRRTPGDFTVGQKQAAVEQLMGWVEAGRGRANTENGDG